MKIGLSASKVGKFWLKLEHKMFKALGREIFKQEALLRVALGEEGISFKDVNITIDHVNGMNYVNDILLPVIYPKRFFLEAERLHHLEKETRFYFNGNMSAQGERASLLEPFERLGATIISSELGRSQLKKTAFNKSYYTGLAKAEFGLCPNQKDWAGPLDTTWTYRFIECCMVNAIPVVFTETPLGNKFTAGFHFVEDKELLAGEVSYDKRLAANNYELARSRFTLDASDVARIKSTLKSNAKYNTQ